MKKVFDWTVGSFFRTIGKTIAILFIGTAIAFILSSNDIRLKLPSFLLIRANASTITEQTNYIGDDYLTITNTNDWTTDSVYYKKTISGSSSIQSFILTYPTRLSEQTERVDFVVFKFMATQPQSNSLSDTVVNQSCRQWRASYDSQGNLTGYDCILAYADAATFATEETTALTNLNINIIINRNDNSWSSCTISGTEVICPTKKLKTKNIEIKVAFNPGYSTTFDFYFMRGFQLHDKLPNTQDIINNQNQNTQSIIQEQQNSTEQLLDSNTTQAESDAEGFFDDFDVPDVGGLSAIITAPLNTIRSLLNTSCSPLVLPLPFVDEDLTLPCMYSIYTTHFGVFFSLYQTIILAVICYRCIRSIFFDILGFTHPSDDRIEVMDL